MPCILAPFRTAVSLGRPEAQATPKKRRRQGLATPWLAFDGCGLRSDARFFANQACILMFNRTSCTEPPKIRPLNLNPAPHGPRPERSTIR